MSASKTCGLFYPAPEERHTCLLLLGGGTRVTVAFAKGRRARTRLRRQTDPNRGLSHTGLPCTHRQIRVPETSVRPAVGVGGPESSAEREGERGGGRETFEFEKTSGRDPSDWFRRYRGLSYGPAGPPVTVFRQKRDLFVLLLRQTEGVNKGRWGPRSSPRQVTQRDVPVEWGSGCQSESLEVRLVSWGPGDLCGLGHGCAVSRPDAQVRSAGVLLQVRRKPRKLRIS